LKPVPIVRGPGPVEEGLKPGTISHVALPAKNRERARRFYEKVFRWELLEVPEWDYSLFETGSPPGGGIGNALIPAEVDVPGALDFILVDSIEETLEMIENASGRVVLGKTEIPQTGWYAIFKDTEGTTLAIWERAPGQDWPYWRQDLLRTAMEGGV
jgi:predicted enzyme related to lactoylglutathione lyase